MLSGGGGHPRAQPVERFTPQGVAAALGEIAEVADAARSDLARLDVAALDLRRGIERVQVVDRRALDHRVVLEGVSANRDGDAPEGRAIALALGEQVLGMQA